MLPAGWLRVGQGWPGSGEGWPGAGLRRTPGKDDVQVRVYADASPGADEGGFPDPDTPDTALPLP